MISQSGSMGNIMSARIDRGHRKSTMQSSSSAALMNRVHHGNAMTDDVQTDL